MSKIHVVSALLVGTPFLQSCTSVPATMAALGVKAVAASIAEQPGENPAVYYQLGRFYQAQNRFDAAATAYEKALAIDTRFYEARNGLGVIFAAQGKHDRAIEQFRIALAQAPLAAHLHNNLAQAYFLQGKYQEAVASFESAAMFDPYNAGTLLRLSQAYAKAGLPEKSQQALRKAQSTQAQSNVAAQSFLGQPGAVVQEQSASEVSAGIEGAGGSIVLPTTVSATAATPVAASPVAASPVAAAPVAAVPTVSATTAVRPAPSSMTGPATITLSSTTELVTSRTEITGKLVAIAPSVYELVVPNTAAARPSLPAVPVLSSAIPTPAPSKLEPSKTMMIGGTLFGDVRITSVAPGVFQLDASPAATQPRTGGTALAAATPSKARSGVAARSQQSAIVPTISDKRATSIPTLSINRVRLEVANGNGISGMAKRVSEKLREFEHYVARLTNQRPAQSASSIEYRDGYIEEAASVAADLQKPVALVLSDNLRRDIQVRLVLGRDIRNDVALVSTPGSTEHRQAASTGQSPVSTLPAAGQQPTAAMPGPVASAIRDAGKRHQPLAVFRTPALLVASGPLQSRDALAILEPRRM